jgi:hypothetical protein
VTRRKLGESLFVGKRRDFLIPNIFPVPAAASDVPETGPAPGAESAPEAEPAQSAAMSEASTERLIKGKINSSNTGWNIQSK